MSDEPLDGITVVTQNTEAYLNPRQLEDYRQQREACLRWLLTFGLDPSEVDGYAHTTVANRADRMDRFYRWVWDREGRYTADVRPEHADAYLEHLAHRDMSNHDKSNHRKALLMLLKWRHHEHGIERWEPQLSFATEDAGPRDYLTRDERRRIGEAALEYGSVPAYGSVTPEQRDRWRIYLAQRFEKPKSADPRAMPSRWGR